MRADAAGEAPIPRLLRTPRDAEMAALDWIAHLGARNPRLSFVGPDEGVDVESDDLVVQVKSGATRTGRPVIQQIYGIAESKDKSGVVFSVAGFSEDAVEWANLVGVALFHLNLSGDTRPVSRSARAMEDQSRGRPSGWGAVQAEIEALKVEGRAGSITALFELANGYRGYWGVWLDADGQIRISRDLTGRATRPVHSAEDGVSRLAKMLREAGGSYWVSRPVISLEGEQRRFVPRPYYPTARPDRPVIAPRERRRLAPIRVTASEIYVLASAPQCERRIFLDARGEPGDDPGPFQVMLMEAGVEHEERHRSSLGEVLDLSQGDLEQRIADTSEALEVSTIPIYQPVLTSTLVTESGPVSVVGVPDFVIPTDFGHVLRDTKVAIRVGPESRPDIAAQMRLYAWLYERVTGRRPLRLEVVAGDGQVHVIPDETDPEVETQVGAIARLHARDDDPGCLVKWSQRGSCPYFTRCWSEALDRNDVSVVPGVTRRLARALQDSGILTIADLVERHSVASLAEFTVTTRAGKRRTVGGRAEEIVLAARSLHEQRPIVIRAPKLPAPPFVLFDIEATPTLGDDDGFVYLWGMRVKGERLSVYTPVLADLTSDARDTWHRFLQEVSQLLGEYGEMPFLHWSHYEKAQIEDLIDRYGDPSGTAAWVLDNLSDLLEITRDSVVLPVHSYSLKIIEEYVGFDRSQTDVGGDWSITAWEEAVAAASPDRRRQLLEGLLRYNDEDLLGLLAVYEWLRDLPN